MTETWYNSPRRGLIESCRIGAGEGLAYFRLGMEIADYGCYASRAGMGDAG
jgi:hypothetical protein